jgi:glycosyltransferase involved in cell wall biosynthesis
MEAEVAEAARHLPGVQWLGRLPHDQVLEQMAQAELLIFPSIWYETFGMTIIEAFSVGLPVVASHLGAMAALVQHARTGLLFTPGNAEELAGKVRSALEKPEILASMRQAAREEYQNKYTPWKNYDQ